MARFNISIFPTLDASINARSASGLEQATKLNDSQTAQIILCNPVNKQTLIT